MPSRLLVRGLVGRPEPKRGQYAGLYDSVKAKVRELEGPPSPKRQKGKRAQGSWARLKRAFEGDGG